MPNIGKMAFVDQWLDDNVGIRYQQEPFAQDWARISKVVEEAGEAIAAFIGATGQNPRKGYTNDMRKVMDELCDVAITALLAMQHFTKDEDTVINLMEERWAYRIAKIEAISSQTSG